VILAILGLLLIVLFAGLGTWQVVRLQWKLALIERVESRVHAAPIAPPPSERWAQVSKENDEYRHVRLAGHFLYEFTTPVQAVSDLGAGFWLLTPFCTTDGAIVLVNRGFIASTGNTAARFPGAVLPLTPAPPLPVRRIRSPVCCASPNRAAASCAKTTRRAIAGSRATWPASPPHAA